jgi:hypothetical protein
MLLRLRGFGKLQKGIFVAKTLTHNQPLFLMGSEGRICTCALRGQSPVL